MRSWIASCIAWSHNGRFLRHRFSPKPTSVATPNRLPKRNHVAKEAVSAAPQWRATWRKGWDVVSSNIKYTVYATAIAFPDVPNERYGKGERSRRHWQTPYFTLSQTEARLYAQATHSGFMGAPTYSTESPLPKGYDPKLDISESIRVDKFIRTEAIGQGVPVNMVQDYGFEDLP